MSQVTVQDCNEFVEGTGTFYKFGYQDLIDILAGQFIPVQVAG